MSCQPSEFQSFIDWLHVPQHGPSINVVNTTLIESAPDLLQERYVGTLDFKPLGIIGIPPFHFNSYFHGTLLNTTGADNLGVVISMSDPISVVVLTMSSPGLTSRATLDGINCSTTDNRLNIRGEGTNNRTYELTLSKSTVVHIPVGLR